MTRVETETAISWEGELEISSSQNNIKYLVIIPIARVCTNSWALQVPPHCRLAHSERKIRGKENQRKDASLHVIKQRTTPKMNLAANNPKGKKTRFQAAHLNE